MIKIGIFVIEKMDFIRDNFFFFNFLQNLNRRIDEERKNRNVLFREKNAISLHWC